MPWVNFMSHFTDQILPGMGEMLSTCWLYHMPGWCGSWWHSAERTPHSKLCHALREARVQNACLCVRAVRGPVVARCGDSGEVLGGQAILLLKNNLVTLPVSSGAFTHRQLPFLGALHWELSIWRAANLINFKQGVYRGRNNGQKFQSF